MKKLYTLTGIIAGLFLGVGLTVQAATTLFPGGGGTGTSTPPTYGQLLVGTSGGVYQLQATSTLNITSTAVGTVSTSSTPTIGNLSYWTSTAYPSLLGTVATTSLTATSPLSLSNAISVIGSSASALSISTAGTWSGNAGTATALADNGANCSSGSFPLGVDASGAVESCTVATTGTVTSIATTYPITGGTITTTGTLGIAFGTTTANTWADTQTFTKAITISEGTTATSTFNGNAWIKGNLQVDGAFFAPVTLVTSGNVNIVGNLGVTGTVDLDTFTSALLLTGAGGDVAEYAGTSCTNQFVRSLSALGASTCASVANADLAGSIAASKISLTKGYFIVGDDAGTAQATSTIFISSTGNVGIGTTTPAFSLDVYGGLRIDPNTGQLVVPYKADPTVTTSGNLAYDTTTASTSIRANIGGTEYAFYTDKEGTFEIASTTLSAENRTFSGNATSTYDFWRPSRKTQINSFACKSNAALLVRIGDGSASTTQVSASAGWTEATSLSNNLFNRNEQIYFEVGTSSTANKLRCRVNYTTQAE